MRQAQREVRDPAVIKNILQKAQVLHLGLTDRDLSAYIVPVSYGFETVGRSFIFYVHSAREGKKVVLSHGPITVTVEIDHLNGYVNTGHGVTADYESFMGQGYTSDVTDRKEKIRALQLIMDHCGVTDIRAEDSEALDRTYIMRITVSEYTAKKRFPDQKR